MCKERVSKRGGACGGGDILLFIGACGGGDFIHPRTVGGFFSLSLRYCRALLRECRPLLRECRAVLRECRVFPRERLRYSFSLSTVMSSSFKGV